ncbi:response regulator transcription factor [Actinoplanes sp. NPDC089786]|uniref:response regulator transcription factor n=1 Tax=Actinoplanes sp. NPDC089786 TaxID=3155185 RepID=UPI00343DC9AB
MQAVRALVVDDHPVFRRGLRSLLADEPWVAEVGEADTVAAAVPAAREADVVAMDVRLPDGDGIDATARILAHRPETAVLLLTMVGDERIVRRGLAAGARGYLLKDTDPDAVVDALRTVGQGGLVLGPRVPATVLTAPAATGPPAPFDRLTARERQLAEHLAGGRTNGQIARVLGVSEKTVRNAVSAVLAKLAVPDRLAVALLARDVGLIPAPSSDDRVHHPFGPVVDARGHHR